MQRILFILLVLVCGCSESGDDDTSTGSSCSTTVDCAGECGGSAVLDCNDECNGTATEDNCGVCDSNASNDDTTCTEDCLGVWGSTTPAPEIADIDDGCDLPVGYLYLLSDGKVLYNSPENIKGFQFVLDGGTANTTVTYANGDAGTAGMLINGMHNATDGYLVLGYSMTGAIVAAGCGTLTELTIDAGSTITGLSSLVIAGETTGSSIDLQYYSCTD